jgi:hypothetical protein
VTPPRPPSYRPDRDPRTRPDLRPARTLDDARAARAAHDAHDARHLGPAERPGRHRPDPRAASLDDLLAGPEGRDEPPIRYDGVAPLVVFVVLVVLLVVGVLWVLPHLLV